MKSLSNFLSIFSIVITFLIIISLAQKKNKELHTKMLFLIFLELLCVLLSYYSSINNIVWLQIIILLPILFAEVIIAPTLLLYIKSLFENPKGLIERNLIHYISIPIYTIFILTIAIHDSKLGNNIDNKNTDVILETITSIYVLVYCFFSLYKLNNYQQKAKSVISSFDTYDVSWIKNFIIGIIVLLTISMGLIYPEYNNLMNDDEVTLLSIITISIFIFYIAYKGITQSKILLPNFIIPEGIEDSKKIKSLEDKKTITNNLLNDDEADSLAIKLSTILTEKKPYLDPYLTLNKLSSMLGVSSKKLSLFLNKHQQKTFYDFINTERVKTVKEKMNHADFKNYTLLAIAYESGFNSKTTFNRIFKKETGVSPSTYRENLH